MGAAPGPEGRSSSGFRERLRAPAVVFLALLVVAGGVLVYDELAGGSEATTVTIVDESGEELGTVDVAVADSFRERYTGLSDTESLGPNEGLLFVHDGEAERTYVMRDMAFPIDIVFVGADRRITAIHHAEVEERPLTPYDGPAKWVLEVPDNWTTAHGVSVGDRIRIERAG